MDFEYRLFQCNCFSVKSTRVISLFEKQLSGLIYLFHVKITNPDVFSEVFTLYSSVFSLKIRITECFK